MLNNSSGVNFATLNRFPHIVEGDYLEGGLTGRPDAQGPAALRRCWCTRWRTPTLTAEGCVAAFELAEQLGYGDQISNRVVDALGDLAGGVRLQDA